MLASVQIHILRPYIYSTYVTPSRNRHSCGIFVLSILYGKHYRSWVFSLAIISGFLSVHFISVSTSSQNPQYCQLLSNHTKFALISGNLSNVFLRKLFISVNFLTFVFYIFLTFSYSDFSYI